MAARRLAAVLVGLAALLVAFPASAEDGTIAHVESTGDGLRVLVEVPAGVEVDVSGATATLDGEDLDASASLASEGSSIERTTILAIDTSASMRGARFSAAKEAARTFLGSAPDDVRVGIVTFDSEVTVDLEPTTDRDAARSVIDGLSLRRDTLLYDGVIGAVEAAGGSGQRTIIVLSDGAHVGSPTTLADVTAAVEETNTLVDVVALGLTGSQLAPLQAMADAGNGQVIEATGDQLGQAFAREADVLASQVLVTAPLPSGFAADEATVEVYLPTGGEPVVARALAPIQSASADPAAAAVPEPGGSTGWQAPGWLLWVGIGVFALGLLAVAVLLVPAKPAPMTIAERVTAYSTLTRGAPEAEEKPANDPVLDQARAAAAGILERNSGLNDRLTRRLAAAGSEFKPSEWLLVHVGVVIAALVVGLLLGKGSVLFGLLFLVVGFLLPPLYLRFKAGRRRKAFDEALPEVLQLLSGALSAGLSLAQAVDTVVREGPEPIASEFRRVLVEARIGVSLEDAFEGVAERFQSRDFAWAVMAIRIQRQVGGNLAELLTTVAATMRERQFLRRHVRALSAEGRLSAMILCGLPPVFALYLFLTNREFLHPLVADVRGFILLGFGAVWMSIGTFWMSRLVKVEV